jgi:hypothetical protein
LLALIASGSVSHPAIAQNFEFIVNADPPRLGLFLHPPTIGLVRADSGQAGNAPDAMVFSWSDEGLEAIPQPICKIFCDGFEVFEYYNAGTHASVERLYLRRFDNVGTPLDTSDVVLSETTVSPNETHGGFFKPSLAVCPVNTGPFQLNPFELGWWETWEWSIISPPCGQTNDCLTNALARWELLWSNFTAPAPSAGSTNFTQPAFCQAMAPSVAFAKTDSRLTAWRQIDGPCHYIFARMTDPVLTSPILIRDPAPGFDVFRPCADGQPGGSSYVVAWREFEHSTAQSAIFARRVFPGGVLGDVVPVASYGDVEGESGPAVCLYPDGSFAVQWVGFDNGDPPVLSIRARTYNTAEPPVIVNEFTIAENLVGRVEHTIACLGTGVGSPSNPTIHLASAYELFDSFFLPKRLYARALDTATGAMGPQTFVPIAATEFEDQYLADAHQHTALLRSDQKIAVTWHRPLDGNNYCTVRELTLGCGGPGCDSIDFNNDGVSPDTLDIDDFLSVFGGGPCSNDPFCNDVDFNNDCVSPDTVDVDLFLFVFGGGTC